MKPATTFLLVLLCACAHAQVKQFEIKAGLGYGSRAFINDGGHLLDFIPILSSRYNTGPIMIEGVYHTGRVRIGISAAYEQNGEKGKYIDFSGQDNGDEFYTKTTTVTLLAGGYYSFIQHKKVSFYMGASAGPSFNSVKDYKKSAAAGNTIKLGYQLTGLGFEYHNIIGFFVEAGYGYKGILCGGLQFHISQR